MKKGMKLIAFILAAVVTVSSVLPANVYANTNVDDNTYVEESILAKQTVSDSQLKSELAELYQKCLQNSGKTSFHGWCGAFVGQQLKALGIDSKTGNGFNGNGNTWYPCLLDNVETNSGHTQKKYAGRDCLKSIAADAGNEPAYNIVVSFPNSTGSNTSYGHVIFIYAIVGNTAYYIESYGTSFGAEGTPIARDIDGLMNEYCSLYGTAQGAVWFSGGGGISYINDDEMFSKYPYYFNDDTYNAMFRNARSEIYDALDNADNSRMLIAIMTALSDGKDLIIKQLLSSVTDGIDSTSDEAIDKATLDFVQTMLGNETFLSSFITSAQSKIKGIKLGYDLFSTTGKEAFSKEASTLLGVHKEVFDLQLSKFLDNTGKVTKITKYGLDVSKVVASAVEMEYINIEVVEQLKTLLIQYGYDNTELYEGISRLDAKLHLDITTRVFDTVANDAVLNILSEVGDTVFNALVSEDMGIAYAIVNVVAKASVYFFYEKLGNGIKLDDVLETYALYEFQDTLFALKTDMYMELLSGKADLSSAAENYELIWNAYRAGIVSGLNSACEITKSKSLKSVRENMKEILTETFTYDKFLERCRAAAMQAVVNGNAVTVGGSNTDSNAESKSEAIVEERLAKIIEMYPSGSSKFEMMYDNKKGSFAFTEFVFRTLYENIIDGTVASDKQYEYSRPYQTTRIGTLHGSEVSEDAVGILISKAKVGDVILGYGEKYGLHSMIFKEATDNGIVVYDSCWDKEKNGDYTVLLHEIPYTELAEWVGNGTSESEGGLSLYHFISYNSLYKRNSEIQADDKDNFIIDENGVLTGYKGYKTFVKIPNTVKAIGDNAFKNNDMIRNIYIPDSVTSIGENAFYDCDQLTSVFIPDSVTSVGSSCFYSCNNLTYAKLTQNMDVVSSHMFYECKKLETVVFGMNVTKIEEGAFWNCSQLKTGLPGNIVEIGTLAFTNCKSITEIIIPKSLTNCGVDIFSGCSNLKTINFEKGITAIPANLFHGTEKGVDWHLDGLEEIDIPETVTTIGDDAFLNCKNLTTVTGMKNVTEIGWSAFDGCNKLVNINLPSKLRKLSGLTFMNCKNITEITIPKSLTDCGYGIFSGCSNLKTINFEKGISVIPSNLFRGAEEYGYSWFDGLEEIDIPETVTTIGDDAFENCKNLTTVTGMKNVTEIGDNAFYNCSNLVNIKLPENLAEIGSYAFHGCSQLKSISIPDTLKGWETDIFSDCTGLATVEIPDDFINIPSDTFLNCSSLKEIKLPVSLKTINSNAFKGSGLTEIIIPGGVTSIGSNAFQNCTSLASVRIPNSVTSLGTYIFDGCSSLTDVTLGKGLTTIPSYMFSNCESLKNIKIPYNVATIGSYAFLNDTAFTEITIPRKTTAINSNAFSYPGKLNIYGISGTYAETFANENNIKFTNREVNASKVELNESQITLNKGDTYNLIMSVTPDDFTDAVTWKSTDTDVVTVTETGVIKAVGTGTATVKLTVGNVSTSCRITVLQPVTSISLDRSSLSLDSADNYQLSAYIYPSTASNKNVVWESSDPSVATVDDNGMVTALKKGTAKITVKAMDGSNVSASCTVTVKNTTYVCDTVDKIESQHNYENECSDSWIYTIEGAECIEVGFDERTAVESGFDYIYIFSADDTMVGQYTGTDLAGKTIRIEGSKVRIKLESDGSGNEWGFKVTSVKRASKSHMMELIPAKEATCIEEGNNSYYYCSECNKYFKDEAGTIETTISDEIIPVKKDHEYVNGYCKYCNKAQYEAGWKKTSTGWWYDNGGGTYPKNEWKYIDGKWYHFDERGYRQTGWKYIGSNWYFFNESGDMRTGWFTRYGKTYYCKPDGSMARQFVKVGSSTYYFDSEGALQTGWKKVGNKWYYMNSNGIVQTGWKQLGKNWYYLNSDGSMQTGWKQVGKYWYYMDSNGVMQTGWKQIGKNWYYMDGNGVMQTG
uniref:leucine-rich repeat protein n=1 Tax=Eshraghiella crossota TaxID=45851 RepID=UPI004028E7DB